MPEVQYKFKSSLSFEIIKFSESSITVGVLKDLINQKQSIKTSGFDLKLKDTHGKIYTNDDEAIDLKSKIIVSRVPKVSKTQLNIKKKDSSVTNNITENPIQSNSEKIVNVPEEKTDESVKVDLIVEKIEQSIPDILKCCLCNQLMKDSMQIKCCKKSYCHECITGYLFDPDISGSLECPDCKSIVSIKDANLVDNMKIRSMVHDFQLGKLDSGNVDTVEDNPSTEEFLMHLENVQEIEITTDISSVQEEEIHVKSYENVECSQIDDLLLPDDRNYNPNGSVVQEQHSPLDHHHTVLNTVLALPEDVDQAQMEFSNDKNNNSSPVDGNLIEQHYHGHSYINSLPEQQLPNKSGIPVINNPQISDVKNKVVVKESANSSIQDLDFDPVMYMTFLKIVGENCPDELRKILSNNNDSLHISKDVRKTSSSTRRKDDDYNEKHSSKKSRYDVESEEFNYKKNYIPAVEKRDSEYRYHENLEKKSNRARSRSKEYYQKKADGYSSNRRSRDYEVRERDYYPSNGARYRASENQNYQENRHSKNRPNYDSINRIKSNKYRRPMNR